VTGVPAWARAAALGALVVLSMVLGAALRPLVVADVPGAAPGLGDTEIAFVQDMLAHHQQALVLVEQLDPAASPVVYRLAQQIRDGQNTEIGTMLGWLRLAGVTPTNPEPMAWMHPQPIGAGHAHGGNVPSAPPATEPMPGAATRDEIYALAAARGRDAEIRFLQLMRRHHDGGVAMAQTAAVVLADGPVRQTAREMVTAQSQESGTMAVMLTRLGAPPP